MKKSSSAFSLVELLAVVAVIAILAALSVPALVSIAQGQGMKRAIHATSDFLEQARSEAMAKSTWVWVGVADTTQNNAARRPEITLVAVMSRDGSTNTAPANLSFLAKPVQVSDVTVLSSATPWAGNAEVVKNSTFQFSATIAGTAKSFSNTVVAFSPQGEALLNPEVVSSWLEIGLREVHGVRAIAAKTASLRISGISGQVVVDY